MTDALEERGKALENEYIHKMEAKRLEEQKAASEEKHAREICQNRCPKCGDKIQALTFRGVPLDKCPSCGGVWLGPKDLQILSQKDHRSWFEKWFGGELEEL